MSRYDRAWNVILVFVGGCSIMLNSLALMGLLMDPQPPHSVITLLVACGLAIWGAFELIFKDKGCP